MPDFVQVRLIVPYLFTAVKPHGALSRLLQYGQIQAGDSRSAKLWVNHPRRSECRCYLSPFLPSVGSTVSWIRVRVSLVVSRLPFILISGQLSFAAPTISLEKKAEARARSSDQYDYAVSIGPSQLENIICISGILHSLGL